MTAAGLLLLGGVVAPVSFVSVAPPCTHANKQVALYLDYLFEPSLATSPATDISIDHIWNSTSDMRRFGHNGVFAAQPIGFGAGRRPIILGL